MTFLFKTIILDHNDKTKFQLSEIIGNFTDIFLNQMAHFHYIFRPATLTIATSRTYWENFFHTNEYICKSDDKILHLDQ